MRIIYFDLCAIPIYAIILWTCCSRKLTQGLANRVFLWMNGVSLVCSVLDVGMEFAVNPLPLSDSRVLLGTAISYAYLLLRNSTLVMYLIFVFAITRTEYRIRPRNVRLLIWLPNAIVVLTLLQSLFTHSVFTVTAEQGYARGPAMAVLYAGAAVYGIAGAAYCVYCKRYLALGKWVSLLSVYALTFLAVFLQLVQPMLLVEMFSTAIALMMIMLMVMRPEETMDATVGIKSWKAYQTELRNILLSGQKVHIVAARMANAQEIRAYLGEDQYCSYVMEVAEEVRALCRKHHIDAEMYFERPGTLYLIADHSVYDVKRLADTFLREAREHTRRYADMGVQFDPRLCLIRCPEDLSDWDDILSLGHKFTRFGPPEQVFFHAADIVASRNFDIENNMEDILTRAIRENRLEMYYQPIYSVKEKRFLSAEALVRLNDSRYGRISPGVFIPAAESLGLILPIGGIVLESVFRFISRHDLKRLGLDYIEINLSVAQCMQSDLPDILRGLMEKYGVTADQVNLEITETTFDNISNVVLENLEQLSKMGFTFSLDDYGTGYSNIQRVSKLPLHIIKIDKSIVDEMFSDNGRVIIRDTVHMMQGIHKQLVVEGAETKQAVDTLADMSCDYIQGFYYSRPLPADEFIEFLKEHNGAA